LPDENPCLSGGKRRETSWPGSEEGKEVSRTKRKNQGPDSKKAEMDLGVEAGIRVRKSQHNDACGPRLIKSETEKLREGLRNPYSLTQKNRRGQTHPENFH